MAIAIAVPDQVEVGDTIVVTGTGFTHSGNVKLTLAAEEGNGGLEVTAVVAADGSGNFTTSGVVDVKPNHEGHVDVTVHDVTAGTTATDSVEVFTTG